MAESVAVITKSFRPLVQFVHVRPNEKLKTLKCPVHKTKCICVFVKRKITDYC